MVDKVTLASVASFDPTMISVINSNNALVTSAIDNTLSRDNSSPNQMLANLDMNSNQILNLPSPATPNSPVRLVDVTSPATIASVPPIGTSGAVVGLLNGNNTASGNDTYSGTSTFSGVATFSTNPVFNAGAIPTASIANNAIDNTKIRQGSARTVIGVTGNATANVADIQGTTRQVLAVNTAGTALAFAQPQGDQLLGTTTNDSASAGNVGEYVSSSVVLGSAVSLTSTSPTNVTSISLTAGDWDVYGACTRTFGASTSITVLRTSLNTTTSTDGSLSAGTMVQYSTAAMVPVTDTTQTIGSVRFSLAAPGTVFLIADDTFTVSTDKVYGLLSARRVR